MATVIQPSVKQDLLRFGAVGLDLCFNCGTCTATCPLSKDGTSFPRNIVRYAQLGLRDKLVAMPEPWLCYYCGECSESCPRDANPAESVMAARRFLTTQYDWTGLAYKMYTSKRWEFGVIIAVALLVVLLFALFHGPIVTDRVALNTFAPVHVIEMADWGMAAVLTFFLLTNIVYMVRKVTTRPGAPKVPWSLYVKELYALPLHAATQKRWSECKDRMNWKKHLFLVTGYVTMFVMIFGFLPWFQTDTVHPVWHPQRLLGYYATAALTADMMIGRFKKRSQMHRFSHPTDWMFLGLLFATALTGILVHIFRVSGLPLATYGMYVLHMAILVPMLLVEVPFGKWSHLAYRPIIAYLHQVGEKARAQAT